MLAIGQQTVREMIAVGKFRTVAVGANGRGVRVLADSLDEYIRAAGYDPAA